MKITENTPTRSRIIQGDAYEAAGQPGFEFSIPQPFTAAHLEPVRELGCDPASVANQLNQVLAENLGNNMAGRIKKAVKAGTDLPTQADMDELIAAYDFTGSRGTVASTGSLFDKVFSKMAGSFLRKLFKKKGYQDLPAPVAVAKRGTEPAQGEIAYDVFEAEVIRLMEGEGPWGEEQLFIDFRAAMIEDAKAEEEAIRARLSSTEDKMASLTL